MLQSPSCQQRGAALIIGLILIVVASIGAVAVMRGNHLHDRMASNHHNKIISQMTAEAGASRFVAWVSDPVRGNDLSTDWSNTQTRATFPNAQTSGSIQFPPYGYFYIPNAPDWTLNPSSVTIVGVARSGNDILAETRLNLRFGIENVGSFGPPPAPPAPLTLGGDLNGFTAGNSNQFSVVGGANNVAVATDQNFAGGDSVVRTAIPGNRTGNYTGGGQSTPSVAAMDLGLPWSDAKELKNLVDHAESTMPNKTAFTAGSGTFDLTDVNIGASGSEKITVVRGNASVSGNKSGAGVLIVTGNLTWSGNPDFKGLVVVLGGTLTWNGGGNNGVRGSVYIANVNQTDPANWSFDSANGTRFNGGGGASLVYDKDLLDNTLSGLAQGGGSGTATRSVKVASWTSY